MKIKKDICPTCGQVIKEGREERISKGLVRSLVLFAQAAKKKGKNDVHLQTECGFTNNEYNNFQKLKYFGLIAKVRVDGKRKSGRWLLTRKGLGFLKGEEIVKRVALDKNGRLDKTKDYSDETTVISNVLDYPYWPKAEDYS